MMRLVLAIFVAVLLHHSSACHWRYGEITYETLDCSTCEVRFTVKIGLGSCAFSSSNPSGFQYLDSFGILTNDPVTSKIMMTSSDTCWNEILPRPPNDGAGNPWRRYECQKTFTFDSCGVDDEYAIVADGSLNRRSYCIANDPGTFAFFVGPQSCYPSACINCNGDDTDPDDMQFEALVDFCTCSEPLWTPLMDTTWNSAAVLIPNLVYFPAGTPSNSYRFPVTNPSPSSSGAIRCELDTASLGTLWHLPECVKPMTTGGTVLMLVDAATCTISWDTSTCVPGQKFLLRMRIYPSDSEPEYTCAGNNNGYTLLDTLVEIVDGVNPTCTVQAEQTLVVCPTLATCPVYTTDANVPTDLPFHTFRIEKPSYTGDFQQFFFDPIVYTAAVPSGFYTASTHQPQFNSGLGTFETCTDNPCPEAGTYPVDLTTYIHTPTAAGLYTETITFCDLYNVCVDCDASLEFAIAPIVRVKVFDDTNINAVFNSPPEIAVELVSFELYDAADNLVAGPISSDVNGDVVFEALDHTLTYGYMLGDFSAVPMYTEWSTGGDIDSTGRINLPNTLSPNDDVAFEAGLLFPQIRATGNGQTLPSDGMNSPTLFDHTAFVDTVVGMSSARTYTIHNDGTATLTISGITSAAMAEFVVSGVPATVAPGGSETFTVTYTPTTLGGITDSITISTDDPAIPGYEFVVGGTGLDGRLSTSGLGMLIVDEDLASSPADNTEFLNAMPATMQTHTFMLENNGNYDLTLVGFSLGGANPAEFMIDTTGTDTDLAPGETTTFDVIFDPDPLIDGFLEAIVMIETDQRSSEAVVFSSVPSYNFAVAANLPPAEFTVYGWRDWWMYDVCRFNWTHNLPPTLTASFFLADDEVPSAPTFEVVSNVVIGDGEGTAWFICHHVFTTLHKMRAQTFGSVYDSRVWPFGPNHQIFVKMFE